MKEVTWHSKDWSKGCEVVWTEPIGYGPPEAPSYGGRLGCLVCSLVLYGVLHWCCVRWLCLGVGEVPIQLTRLSFWWGVPVVVWDRSGALLSVCPPLPQPVVPAVIWLAAFPIAATPLSSVAPLGWARSWARPCCCWSPTPSFGCGVQSPCPQSCRMAVSGVKIVSFLQFGLHIMHFLPSVVCLLLAIFDVLDYRWPTDWLSHL